MDFYVEDTANTDVAALAERLGIKGIIIFSDKEYSLHIDSREERWEAYYSHENDEYEEFTRMMVDIALAFLNGVKSCVSLLSWPK